MTCQEAIGFILTGCSSLKSRFMRKLPNLFKANQAKSPSPNTTKIKDLIILVLAVGLVAIALADKDFRLVYSSVASSVITAQLVNQDKPKSES